MVLIDTCTMVKKDTIISLLSGDTPSALCPGHALIGLCIIEQKAIIPKQIIHVTVHSTISPAWSYVTSFVPHVLANSQPLIPFKQ